MEKKPKIIHGLELPTVAARIVGMPQQTLHSAIARGDVPTSALEGGTIVVRIADVRRYLANPPKRGPKPQAAAE